ncbi:MAG: hypothetical protein GYA87_01685 [Christensenellaceae bacterium]|nr:hypothetical protein [Christensenellaceae bacterium]
MPRDKKFKEELSAIIEYSSDKWLSHAEFVLWIALLNMARNQSNEQYLNNVLSVSNIRLMGASCFSSEKKF